MNLIALRYFLTLADAASFTRAAARLNVTQPALSTAIARLEGQLGTRLFDRDRKRIVLTEAGQKLLPRAQTMLAEWRLAETELSRSEPRQRLRVGLLATLAQGPVTAFAARLSGSSDAFDLELHEAAAGPLAARLLQGALDVALTRLDDAPSGLAVQPILRERYLLAVATGNLLATRHRCSVRDLAGLPFAIRARCEITDAARAVFAQHGVRPPVLIRSASEDHVAGLVTAGLAGCFLPESLARPGMALLPIDELPLTRRLGLLARPGLPEVLSERAREAAQAINWRRADSAASLGFAH